MTYSLNRMFEPSATTLAELVRLYGEVFAEPPYFEGPEDVQRFGEGLAVHVNAPGFALVELTVHPTRRRAGIGRSIHDELLTTRRAGRAVLLVQPERRGRRSRPSQHR